MSLLILDENNKNYKNKKWIIINNIYKFNIKPVNNITNTLYIYNENNINVEAYNYIYIGKLLIKDNKIKKPIIIGYLVIENNDIKIISNIKYIYHNNNIIIIKSNNIYYYLEEPYFYNKNEINIILYNIDINIRCFIAENKKNIKLYLVKNCDKNIIKNIIDNTMEIDDYWLGNCELGKPVVSQ